MNRNKVTVLDYGLGNIRSVAKALERAGADVVLAASGSELSAAAKLVVPGVGAFRRAMDNMKALGLTDALAQYLRADRPYLGICLGMQILMTESHEFGTTPGFGAVPGSVKRFDAAEKIPHMGWNQVDYKASCPLFDGLSQGEYFYFDHSYVACCEDPTHAAAVTQYGCSFTSAVMRGNICGVQFHPEKSALKGIRLLENFITNVR